jgi:heme/copper-type cytochrome/quinol oxidase subunit 2
MRDRRLLYLLLAVAALVGLFIVFRQGNDNGESASTTTATTESEPTTEPTTGKTTAPTTPTVTTPQVTRWRIDSRDDSLDRLSVPKDTRLRIVAIADVTDHVHVHGYDLMADVAPGAPAVIAFTADAPGRFEIELEDRGRQIAQLNVQP